MKRIIVVLFLALIMIGSVAVAEDGGADSKAYINIGDYNSDVIALHQKLGELGYYGLRPESPWSEKSASALKALQNDNGISPTGVVNTSDEIKAIMAVTKPNRNLVRGYTGDWSQWMTPDFNEQNKGFTVAKAVLNDKEIGDMFICSVEIEFKNVSATEEQSFAFRTQGAVDGRWDYWYDNIWNRNLVDLESVPENGIYEFSVINPIKESTVDGKEFYLGFRCDYWASGSFRIRNVRVESASE